MHGDGNPARSPVRAAWPRSYLDPLGVCRQEFSLRLEQIPLYQVHALDPNVPFAESISAPAD
jgi:hypothetical protein